jgi:hypothetical protein
MRIHNMASSTPSLVNITSPVSNINKNYWKRLCILSKIWVKKHLFLLNKFWDYTFEIWDIIILIHIFNYLNQIVRIKSVTRWIRKSNSNQTISVFVWTLVWVLLLSLHWIKPNYFTSIIGLDIGFMSFKINHQIKIE